MGKLEKQWLEQSIEGLMRRVCSRGFVQCEAKKFVLYFIGNFITHFVSIFF